jgi:membrane protease YdiL (CAAX protease family)
LFAPALALARAAEYEPGRGTRLAAALSVLSRAGIVAPAQELILTGLVYPTLRRRWPVPLAAPVCAALGALLHARPTECGVDPCLWPALQAAAAQAAASLFSVLAYERFRTLWIPLVWQAGFVMMRMAPGLPAILGP